MGSVCETLGKSFEALYFIFMTPWGVSFSFRRVDACTIDNQPLAFSAPRRSLEPDDDVSELGPREVAVKMLFAPINPSDINQVPDRL